MQVNKPSSTRSDKRKAFQKIEKDYEKLYLTINKIHTLNGFDKLSENETITLDSGNDPNIKRQKEFDRGKKIYTKLMALKAKYYEMKGIITTETNEKGEIVFVPGPNAPVTVEVEQRPATEEEIQNSGLVKIHRENVENGVIN